MEKVKNYSRNRMHYSRHRGRINYVSNGFKSTYTRQVYTELGKENVKWVDQRGIEAPTSLVPLFENVYNNSKLKSNKLEATVLQISRE